jgi:hypothetical protein
VTNCYYNSVLSVGYANGATPITMTSLNSSVSKLNSGAYPNAYVNGTNSPMLAWEGETVAHETSTETTESATEATTEENEPPTDAEGYYLISNAEQLYYIANLANKATANVENIRARLVNDITVNDGTINASSTSAREWTPIESWHGIFDGQGHSISGLYVVTSGYCGFIVWLQSGTVKNLDIKNSYFTTTNTYYCGSIAAINYSGKIENCSSSAIVDGSAGCMGGLVGYNARIIKNCSSSATVSSTSDYAGGIVGLNKDNGSVKGCFATGTVSGAQYSGGLVGFNKGVIENSGSKATVSGTLLAGGIAGGLYLGSVENCYSLSNVSATYSRSIGYVFSDSNTTVTNCYYLSGRASDGNAEALSSSAFTSGEAAYKLNGSESGVERWYQNLDNGDTVDPYPVPFKGHGLVYKVTNGYSNTPDIRGDVNNDGKVNSVDAALILKYLDGALTDFASRYNLAMADANVDNAVDMKDVIYILKAVEE